MSKPTDRYDPVVSSMGRLIELETQKIDTLRELKKFYILAGLLGLEPDNLKGKVSVKADAGPMRHKPWRRGKLHITHEGEVTTMPLEDAPQEVWPARIMGDYGSVPLTKPPQRKES